VRAQRGGWGNVGRVYRYYLPPEHREEGGPKINGKATATVNERTGGVRWKKILVATVGMQPLWVKRVKSRFLIGERAPDEETKILSERGIPRKKKKAGVTVRPTPVARSRGLVMDESERRPAAALGIPKRGGRVVEDDTESVTSPRETKKRFWGLRSIQTHADDRGVEEKSTTWSKRGTSLSTF